MLRIILGAFALALSVCAPAQAQAPFPFNLFDRREEPPVAIEPARPPRAVPQAVRPQRSAERPSQGFKHCEDPNPEDYANDTIIVSTCKLILYHIDQEGKRYTYRIGGGREGFRWAGVGYVGRMAEWPDWYPPDEMIAREPRLREHLQPMKNGRLGMPGGVKNALGARALYIFDEKTKAVTEYRIHGTNNPSSIGHWMSSGCVRMMNHQVMALYEKVRVGTKVVVLN